VFVAAMSLYPSSVVRAVVLVLKVYLIDSNSLEFSRNITFRRNNFLEFLSKEKKKKRKERERNQKILSRVYVNLESNWN